MVIENLMAMYITDDASYTTYRKKMVPILEKHGGGFGYDFKVSEVLKSEVNQPINRVFTIYFKDEATMNRFFSNEEYISIKKAYFEKAVSSVVQIAKYQK